MIMAIHSLLVPLDNDPSLARRLRIAVQLAQRFDCRVSGVAATGLVNLPSGAENAAPLAHYAALSRDRLRDNAEAATQTFRDTCVASHVKAFEASVDEDSMARSAIRCSHSHDLTLLVQGRSDASGRGLSRDDLEHIVVASPRPSLVLPLEAPLDSLGTRVLLAWDGSREATRAVTDSLPLLKQANAIDVIAWKEPGADDDPVLSQHLEALQRWLGDAKVKANVHLESAAGPIASVMMARAMALRADLLVMGAYGHSRLAERVLGGATRGVLREMTVPVLLSH
jgi:nucleotide-binding universal stress UspA family protein